MNNQFLNVHTVQIIDGSADVIDRILINTEEIEQIKRKNIDGIECNQIIMSSGRHIIIKEDAFSALQEAKEEDKND